MRLIGKLCQFNGFFHDEQDWTQSSNFVSSSDGLENCHKVTETYLIFYGWFLNNLYSHPTRNASADEIVIRTKIRPLSLLENCGEEEVAK